MIGRERRLLLTFFLFLTLYSSQVTSQDADYCAKVCKVSKNYKKACNTVKFEDKVYYAKAHDVLKKQKDLSEMEFKRQFKEELARIINVENIYTYGYDSEVVPKTLLITDEIGEGLSQIALFYTGELVEKSLKRSNVWDIEHVWAKSYGFSSKSKENKAYWDLHNLRPCDSNLNRYFKNDKFFANGGSNSCVPEKCESWGNKTDVSYEPPDNYKGDSARIIFYMELMYHNSTYKLELVDNPDKTNKQSAFGSKKDLLEWSKFDDISPVEKERNAKIYCIQGNRNPFIDHPSWVRMIYDDSWNFNEDVSNMTLSDGNEKFEPSGPGEIPDSPRMNAVSVAVLVVISFIATFFIVGVVFNTLKGKKGLDRLPFYDTIQKQSNPA